MLAVLPAATTSGVVIPCSANPLPLTFALETVTLVLPEFFSSIVCDLVVPMDTLPKGPLVGVLLNVFASALWPADLLAVIPPNSIAADAIVTRIFFLHA
jgi:hypothetical protein